MFKKLTTVLSIIFILSSLVILSGTVIAANEGKNITVKSSGQGIWMLPGKRALDPEVFGTPEEPRLTHLLPLNARMVDEDENRFTTTKQPGPFSNNVKEIEGSINIEVTDKTILDSPNSMDKATLSAKFIGPKGNNNYKVELKKVIPVGPHHQFFGGVGTNVYMHGATGIGEPLMPGTISYVTLWGLGNFYRNGEMVDSNRIVHVMLTPRLRSEDYKLGFGIAQKDELEIHLILPPEKVEDGHPVESPVPTGIKLPNGNTQPYIHVNFYEDIEVTGNDFLN